MVEVEIKSIEVKKLDFFFFKKELNYLYKFLIFVVEDPERKIIINYCAT